MPTHRIEDILVNPRWIWISGGLHALIGSAIVFFSIHPLRAHLSSDLLELALIVSTLQAIQGIALLVLSGQPGTGWPAILIASGTACFSAMLYFIIFTGTHPLDALVPVGGVAMLIGWVLLLFTKPRASDDA